MEIQTFFKNFCLMMHTALGLSVSVSVCHKSRSSIKTVERIGLVFGMRAVFNLPYTVL